MRIQNLSFLKTSILCSLCRCLFFVFALTYFASSAPLTFAQNGEYGLRCDVEECERNIFGKITDGKTLFQRVEKLELNLFREKKAGPIGERIQALMLQCTPLVSGRKLPSEATPNPQTVDNLLSTAHDHFQAGDLSKSRELYKKILESDGKNVDALYSLGLLAEIDKDELSAHSYFRAAFRLKPDDAEIKESLEKLSAKLKKDKQRNDAQLIEDLSKQAKDDFDKGKYQSACRALIDVLIKEPDNAGAHFAIGEVYRKLGKFEKSIYHLCRANVLDPDNKEIQAALSATRRVAMGLSPTPKAGELTPFATDLGANIPGFNGGFSPRSSTQLGFPQSYYPPLRNPYERRYTPARAAIVGTLVGAGIGALMGSLYGDGARRGAMYGGTFGGLIGLMRGR